MADPTPAPEPTPTPTPTPEPAKTPDAPGSILDEAIAKAKPEGEVKDPPKEPEPTKAGAPEKYTDFKLPEGVELNGEKLDKVTATFKELGLDQAGAQKLLDYHLAELKENSEAGAKFWQETQEVWKDEIRSDPMLGKSYENGTLGASIAKMIAAIPTPQAEAFREAMNFTGAGNNPAIVRGFYELSKRFAEPGHVQGAAPATSKARPSIAQALYPTKKE